MHFPFALSLSKGGPRATAADDGRRPQAHRNRALFVLPLLALASRVWDFGNPVIHVDEQYYLLVGDRLLHGAVPYIDLWDRKPVGLFLLYAAMRLLGGEGVLAYQALACLFAAATALVVAQAARTVGADQRGALAAGAAYLLGLSLLGGRGGQAPVFYDLPVAIAGLLALRLPALAAAGRTRAIVASGAVACALAGVAIQIKYTAAIEGALFGLAHLYFLHRSGARLPALVGAASLWLTLGLAPTLAAAGWYGTHGLGPAWWFANFTSIGLRPGYPADQLAMRLLGIGAQLAPLAVAAAVSWRERDRLAQPVALAWLLAAVAGFLAIGTWFDHYALPLLAPLAVAAAPALGRRMRLLVAVLGLMTAIWAVERWSARDDGPGARAVAALVERESRGDCPYVFIGDTVTYLLAHACSPTAYAFPNFLAYNTEQGATGIDEAATVRRILARRPRVIVTSDRRLQIWNRGSLGAVKAALPAYRLALRVPRSGWHTLVYVRRPAIDPAVPPSRATPPARP